MENTTVRIVQSLRKQIFKITKVNGVSTRLYFVRNPIVQTVWYLRELNHLIKTKREVQIEYILSNPWIFRCYFDCHINYLFYPPEEKERP
jgi:hypothetical protein